MEKILVVDDEELMLRALRRCLQSTLEVHVATSAQAALALLRTNPGFAVIISDLGMPQMNGARFLQQARELDPHAVQILLTGTIGFERILGPKEDNGIFAYLTKPCPTEQLKATIDAAVQLHAGNCERLVATGAVVTHT